MEGIKLNLYYYHNIILLTMTLKNNSDRLSSTLSFHFGPSFTRGHLWNYLEFTKLVSSGENAPILFSLLVFPFERLHASIIEKPLIYIRMLC